VALHVLFFLSLVLEYRFLSSGWKVLWPAWLTLFLAAQALRLWVMASLGRFWTTRIIVVPGSARIAAGPYSNLRHPNYIVVAIEVMVVPVMCGAYMTAVVFSILNIILLRIRIREEESALRQTANP
jgi:methyltransferase